MAQQQTLLEMKVPGTPASALILRMTLGGVAVCSDLSVDEMDDLRFAVDEAWDCLTHQGGEVASVGVDVIRRGTTLSLSLKAHADHTPAGEAPQGDEVAVTRAILETLVPDVKLSTDESGFIRHIEMTLRPGA